MAKKSGIVRLVICVVVMAFLVPAVCFGQISGRQKLMAKRAAELDAYRNITERILGLRVSSNSEVRDFVNESDRITLSMDHFIKGLAIDDDQTVWLSDGSCEVVVEVTLSKVIKELETTCDQYYKGGKWTKVMFEKITTHTEERTLTEYGSAAVRATSEIADPQDVPIVMDIINPRSKRIILPDIYTTYPAKNRLMAKRVATADAYRKLAERVYGLRINAKTTVNDFVGEDVIRSRMDHYLKGAKITDVRYQPDGIIEVQVTLKLKSVVTTLKKVLDEYYNKSGKKYKSESFEEIEKENRYRSIAVIGMGSVDQKAAATSGIGSIGQGVRRTVTVEIITESPEVIEIK